MLLSDNTPKSWYISYLSHEHLALRACAGFLNIEGETFMPHFSFIWG